ncbi:MAG: hypothetical protein ACOCYP_07930 [Planctomycetota bacterium]
MSEPAGDRPGPSDAPLCTGDCTSCGHTGTHLDEHAMPTHTPGPFAGPGLALRALVFFGAPVCCLIAATLLLRSLRPEATDSLQLAVALGALGLGVAGGALFARLPSHREPRGPVHVE